MSRTLKGSTVLYEGLAPNITVYRASLFIINKPGCLYCRLFQFYCLCRAGVQWHNPLHRGNPTLLVPKIALHCHEVAGPQRPTWHCSVRMNPLSGSHYGDAGHNTFAAREGSSPAISEGHHTAHQLSLGFSFGRKLHSWGQLAMALAWTMQQHQQDKSSTVAQSLFWAYLGN